MKIGQGKIEFVVDERDLDEALAIVHEKSNYHCIVGTRPLGTSVLVQVLGISLTPSEQSTMDERLREQASVSHFAVGSARKEEDF